MAGQRPAKKRAPARGTRKRKQPPGIAPLMLRLVVVLCVLATAAVGYWWYATDTAPDATRQKAAASKSQPAKTAQQSGAPARPAVPASNGDAPARPSAPASNGDAKDTRTAQPAPPTVVKDDAAAAAKEPAGSPFGQAGAAADDTRHLGPSAPLRPGAGVAGGGTARGTVSRDALPYEEALDAPLEEGVKQVDYALFQALLRLDIDRSRLQLEAVENRKVNGESYHFQRMRLHLSGAPENFVQALAQSLGAWADRARLERKADDLLLVGVDGHPTHQITLSLYEGGPLPQVEVPPGTARLAIIIDDIGESMAAVKELLALDFPVTFAIWPRSTHMRESAEAVHRAGREIMIHQPMEPEQYPKVKPGPGALFVKMTKDEILSTLRENMARVPYAVGLNNHMGSRFTRNTAAIGAVCEGLQGTGLFALDSLTHTSSVFYQEARRAGLSAYRRSVFLDVINDRRSIVHQLDKAASMAHAEGQAIAIGHPLPETIAALKEWSRTRDRRVTIVTVRQLAPGVAARSGARTGG